MHFVYAGYHYFGNDNKLGSFILNELKKHKIKSVMVTSIFLYRAYLITKEKMESYCKGIYREYTGKDSVNDDLESLFENIRLGKEPDKMQWYNRTYFLPKLTEKELELVKRRDTSYLRTFHDFGVYEFNPDVDETEMMLSESDSKYVRGESRRRTFVIENSLKKSLQNKCSLQ